MKRSFFCLLVFILIGIGGCSGTGNEKNIDSDTNSASKNQVSINGNTLSGISSNISNHRSSNSDQSDQLIMLTKRLAAKLYLNIKPNNSSANIAVGTFTDLTTLLGSQDSLPLKTLGLQLEDGLMTESVQRGFKVIDYRLRENLTLTKDANLMLSRDLKDITKYQNIHYFLTGTIAVRDENILINARLINVNNKEVVAAATSMLTTKELGHPNSISLQSGKIYRTSKNSNRGNK